jgi:Fic family protein
VDFGAIKDSPVGELVPISGTDGRTRARYESFAFLAAPLPRELDLSAATWTTVAQAEASLARLDEAARRIPEPALLRRPALRREAQSTSALEGTHAPFEDVLESNVEDRARLPLEVREILNYVVAAEEGFEWIEERQLTGSLVRSLQHTLVQGTPGEYSDAGQLRDRQVFIGPEDAPIEQARFVPAPFGDQLKAGFDAWMDWVNDPPETMPPVVQAALAHYQFETVHPFSDGNGRIGRLLIVLQLIQYGVLEHPMLVVSPWFEARRDEYQGALLALSQTGRWGDWVQFFATGVGAAARATRARIEALLSLRAETIETVREARVSGVAERLAGELIGAPILRAGQVAAAHDVTPQAAMNALRRLAQLGIVTERSRNGRVSFHAERVVELLSQ